MSANPANVSPLKAVEVLSVFVRGRIERTRMHEKSRYTVVAVPAADEYSSPQRVEVQSRGQVGQVGEVVSLNCKLRGWMRQFDTKSGERGERGAFALELVEG
jgi:hypothetical protein